jgi:hypothetical protein
MDDQIMGANIVFDDSIPPNVIRVVTVTEAALSQKIQELQSEVDALRKTQWKWQYPESDPPIHPGDIRGPLCLVSCYEFGMTPALAVARPSWSSLPGQLLKWYLAEDFYNLERPWEIAQAVIGYMILPEPMKVQNELFK